MSKNLASNDRLMQNAVGSIFDEREEFLVIALTGKISSGCTTVAKLLTNTLEENLLSYQNPGATGFNSQYEREARIIQRFYAQHQLVFRIVKVRDIIISYILEDRNVWDRFIEDIWIHGDNTKKKEIIGNSILEKLKSELNKFEIFKQVKKEKIIDELIILNRRTFYRLDESNVSSNSKYDYICHVLPAVGNALHELPDLEKTYTELFQLYGNELRFAGTLDKTKRKLILLDSIFDRKYHDFSSSPATGSIDTMQLFSQKNPIFTLSVRINDVIKILREPDSNLPKQKVAIVIDSIKNIYESNYLKNRYSNYYLLSISRDEVERITKLRKKKPYYSDEDIQALDYNERPNETKKRIVLFASLFMEVLNDETIKATKRYIDMLNEYIGSIAIQDLSKLLQVAQGRNVTATKKLAPLVFDGLIYKSVQYVKENYATLISKNPDWKKMPPFLFIYYSKALRDPVRIFAYSAGLHQLFLQDVEACIQNADIFIRNRADTPAKPYLKQSLVRYLSLMMHPGLIPPTPVERCMQIAFTAKVNSGCISRQVGAVVTDRHFEILSLGWNDVPKGQLSCVYRNLIDVAHSLDGEAYSDYEKSPDSDFQHFLSDINIDCKNVPSVLEGVPYCFCFKDYQEELTGVKNSMDSRAMHGEEKALLVCDQQRVKGGFLFTTSSPCEMCAKNAKEHGIRKIYYIEPYPGISQSHVCNSGQNNNRAEYILFEGAIGRAYTQLYTPIIPLKDELTLRGVKSLRVKKTSK